MNKNISKLLLIIITLLLGGGLCALIFSLIFGSAFWLAQSEAAAIEATPRLIRQVQPLAWSTPTATPTPPPTFTPLPTSTATPSLTPSPSPTPTPTATPTPLPSDTPTPRPLPPTATPTPTETPTPAPPSYPFIIKESAQFDTNHLNFDIYIAIVDNRNKPLSDYRIVGTHSSGLQITSSPSAGDWTENSGAMHYKGGNLKYEAPNSPTGVWHLQLVDAGNQPVAPPVEFSFDVDHPSWYFLIYERQ